MSIGAQTKFKCPGCKRKLRYFHPGVSDTIVCWPCERLFKSDGTERISNEPDTKTCNRCWNELGVEEFYKARSNKDGLRTHCKTCAKAYEKARSKQKMAANSTWRRKNPERYRAWHKKYHSDYYLRVTKVKRAKVKRGESYAL